MNILLFLIPVSMAALGVALWAFIWAVKRGQFEDMDTPALDILREDEHDRPVAAPRSDTKPAAVDTPVPPVVAEPADHPGSGDNRPQSPQD